MIFFPFQFVIFAVVFAALISVSSAMPEPAALPEAEPHYGYRYRVIKYPVFKRRWYGYGYGRRGYYG